MHIFLLVFVVMYNVVIFLVFARLFLLQGQATMYLRFMRTLSKMCDENDEDKRVQMMRDARPDAFFGFWPFKRRV